MGYNFVYAFTNWGEYQFYVVPTADRRSSDWRNQLLSLYISISLRRRSAMVTVAQQNDLCMGCNYILTSLSIHLLALILIT